MIKTEDVNCYTYEVNMIVQIIAKDEPTAKEQLNEKGGTVTSRNVNLLDCLSLYNGDTK